MSWEQIVKGSWASQHSAEWASQPRIGLAKGGLVLNKPLTDALKVGQGDPFLVLIDRVNCKVGLKIAETDEDKLGAYFLRPNGGSGRKNNSLILTARKVAQEFPLAVGHDYPVKMPEGSMVLEVQLPNPRANKG